MAKKEKDKLISLKEATKYCSYSPAYLNLRARQGKLKAVKFGRNWMTKKEWIEDYLSGVGKDNKNYISLKEATKYCSYSPAYLNLRARQGKLKAVKFGRNWMTKKEWIEDYVSKIEEKKTEENYISLKEATKYCSYSPAYLNLRARQGKLKAVKFGRNWMTKKEWIEDYLDQYSKGKKKKKPEKKVLHNLPAGEFRISEPARIIVREFGKRRRCLSLAYALTVAALFFFSISALDFIQGKNYTERIFTKTYQLVNYIEEEGEETRNVSISTVKKFALSQKAEMEEGLLIGYGKWVYRKITSLGSALKIKIASLFLPEKGRVEEGMVVVPSTEEDEKTKEKIKAAFSDEVKIKPDDRSSGIIVPVFRESVGEDYMYLLVPTKENKK